MWMKALEELLHGPCGEIVFWSAVSKVKNEILTSVSEVCRVLIIKFSQSTSNLKKCHVLEVIEAELEHMVTYAPE